ncbi:MAG: hypothetical protein CMQ41_16480 [Gammaproteobacteria bacterium]|nr:hypothetical protein [Gammaproteobacteria bacterium]|tara:strand:+ start:238 stop:405 length:168 start_codon:yes stop_codon:yes gene_type:complete
MITHSNQKNKTVSEGPIEKITTDQLLGDQKRLQIVHRGDEYVLRITSNDKLILTK